MVDVGSLVQAGANLNIGAWNYLNERRAQNLNVELTRETNEQNERLFNQQLQWNEDMYNKYSSPEALVSQYRQAGLNPNLMLKGATAGSTPASVTPPILQAPHVQPALFQADLSGLSGAFLRGAQMDNIQASTDAQRIKNRFAILKEIMDLREQQSRVDVNSQQGRLLGRQIKQYTIELKYMDDYMQARNDAQRETVGLIHNQALTEFYKGEYQQMVNDAFPELSARQTALLSAQTFAAYKSGIASQASADLSNELRRHEAIKAIGTTIENGIKSGQFTLQQLGMNEAEFNALRVGNELKWAKSSKIHQGILGAIDVLTEVPSAILRHLK